MIVYDNIEDLLINMMPMLCLPFIMVTLKYLFKIVKGIARGTEIVENERRKKIKKYDEKIIELEKAEKKINIDKDLQKYFNYKE